MTDDQKHLAEAVRAACVQAALDAYEDAGIRGLCHEGRWEIAVEAIRHLDLDAVIRKRREEGKEKGEEDASASFLGSSSRGSTS